MLVSKNWLNEYVTNTLEASSLEKELTGLGLEVESVSSLRNGISSIVAGKIVTIEKHPDADKLVICQVDVGKEVLTIVTGANNVYEGMVVPVALIGGKVIQGPIKESKLRGVSSFGMLCSGEELGIDSSVLNDFEKYGILPLPETTVLGADIELVLGLDDDILDIDLTPNRSDCYGIYNVAREVAIAYDTNIKPLEIKEGVEDASLITVNIEEEELCHRYIARVIRNIKLGPSPLWFQNFLRSAGVRPISNLVDITNYVMLELGHPMHAFDLDTLASNRIHVRKAKNNEIFVTLDGVKREVTEEMLAICDDEKTVALAGVMGGLNSEVTENTKNVLLEAAHFNGANIRKTSRKLGLRSEASSRFEKGLSEDNTLIAMNRAAYLIELLDMGEVEEVYADSYPVKQNIPVIYVEVDCVNKVLGMSISKEEMINIFEKLDFKVEERNNILGVTPLPHRIDITSYVDLIEEVIRIYGYDKLPAILPEGTTNVLDQDFKITLGCQAKNKMAALGFNEVITYSFIDPNYFDKIRLDNIAVERDAVKIMNPISENQSVMRTMLLPNILEIASSNYKRQQKDLSLFEVGRIFKRAGQEKPLEEQRLGALILGRDIKQWYGKESVDFFYLKGILRSLINSLGTDFRLEREVENKTYHPGRCGTILIDNQVVGIIGELHPQVAAAYDIKERIYYFEITLENFKPQTVPQYNPLPKYPSVERDMAFIVPQNVSMAQIKSVVEKAAHAENVVDYHLFDVYEGAQIEADYKSVAYQIIYQDKNKTLTDEKVSVIHDGILKGLQYELGAKLR
ncbi:hypothetical protein AZF37_04255 [endosymbiont 'TC1' of Trimyema compressum]|uniref:phenylalanine--tRNA ligase subunit beta n=1 Tax=endosymbiont 'TC1' of Trimyema compressum TaxID=243899 RepID=UPI0007F0827D|nr:phenylalanine--tRNA ligase subunit beta [endosymbiont 'TC1' of Trimyema compressum]AMP20482.1 hypothetical protein AZF37_04255 [endosymbiont 'TC1' of Trimyema compressum]